MNVLVGLAVGIIAVTVAIYAITTFYSALGA